MEKKCVNLNITNPRLFIRVQNQINNCLCVQRWWKGRPLLGVTDFPSHPYYEVKPREDNLQCVCGDLLKSVSATYPLPPPSAEVGWLQGRAEPELCHGIAPPASFPGTALRTSCSSLCLLCLGLHSPGLDPSFRNHGMCPVCFWMCSRASDCIEKRKNTVVTCSWYELFLLHQLPAYNSQATKYQLLTHEIKRVSKYSLEVYFQIFIFQDSCHTDLSRGLALITASSRLFLPLMKESMKNNIKHFSIST